MLLLDVKYNNIKQHNKNITQLKLQLSDPCTVNK